MNMQYTICALGLFSILSFGAKASESYTCELDASKSKNWIPSTVQLTFNDDKQLTSLNSEDYDYDIEKAKVLRYTEDFREIKYLATLKNTKNKKLNTIHTITILPKLNNKISYMMKFSHYNNHYQASGKCVKT